MPSATSHNDPAVSPMTQPWPAHFTTVKDEFSVLRSTAGVFHASNRAKIRLTGNDRVRWLNGMITNNIRDLARGYGVYAFLLNPQGHILGDLYAYHHGDSFLIDTDQSQLDKILATFDHYIIMDDVEVDDISGTLTTVGLIGPSSQSILKAAGLTIADLQPLQFTEVTLGEIPCTLIRGPHRSCSGRPTLPAPFAGGWDCFELWVSPKHGAEVIARVQSAGATPVGHEALELHRIALGAPRYAQDIRERDLPQETEQSQALNFNKGCYVGQEIVERIRSRGNVHRKFTGFRTSAPRPAPGLKIQLQAKDVGEITSTATIPGPQGDQTVALGYIRREFSTPGKEVQIDGQSATISDLPFADLLAS
jgi:folate-binding protein YgfZ